MDKPNGYHIRAEHHDGRVVKGDIKVNNIQAIHIALANHGFIVNEYRPTIVKKQRISKPYRTNYRAI